MPKYEVTRGRVTVGKNVTLEMSEDEAKRHGSRLAKVASKPGRKPKAKEELHVQPAESEQVSDESAQSNG